MENRTSHRPPAPVMRPRCGRLRRGVTMPEIMVVIGIIVVLLAILLPALRAVRTQSLTTSAMNNLRQTSTFMRAYERDNRETIVPSHFDFRSNVFTYKGHVRAIEYRGQPVDPIYGSRHEGTWADILWTTNEVGSFPAAATELGHDYRYEVPDKALYDTVPGTVLNPFRSTMANTRDSQGDGRPTPYGTGAHERGYPGFFAANDFFSASPNAPAYMGTPTPDTGRWWSTGQIRSPERSLYLIDSVTGQVIAPVAAAYDNIPSAGGVRSIEVDFRYSGSALMLMLDGSTRPEGPWDNLEDLEARGIRVRELDRR